MKIQLAASDEDILKCREVILELRPHLKEENFVFITRRMFSEGTKMVFIEENGRAVAAGVFRINYYYHRGKNIYIDDLTTLPESRSKGYGKKILDWIKQYGIDHEVANIHLDSGTHRVGAHKLYLNYGFKITSFHFAMDL